MENNTSLAIFETHKIRRHFDEKTETWYFSVIDIVAALTEQVDYNRAKTYWTTLKNRLKNEGSEVVTNCDQLKMLAQDGKMRETDVANVENILRLVQSIPSKKAEPIKLWLAKVGYDRMQEMSDPEKALNRSREYWQKQGRSEKWIQQRMTGQETRNKLTDYWVESGVKKGNEFAIVTNIEKDSLDNTNFRKVLYTSIHIQLVLMSLKPKEDIGMEVYPDNDQFFRFESGTGKCFVDDTEYEVSDGFCVVIPAGAKHNMVNTSDTKDLKMYTLYSPAHHKDRIVRETKEDAKVRDVEFDGITSE